MAPKKVHFEKKSFDHKGGLSASEKDELRQLRAERTEKEDSARRKKDQHSLLKTIRKEFSKSGKVSKKNDSDSGASSDSSSDDSDSGEDKRRPTKLIKKVAKDLATEKKEAKKSRRSIESTLQVLSEQLKELRDSVKRREQSDRDSKSHARAERRKSLESDTSGPSTRSRSLSPTYLDKLKAAPPIVSEKKKKSKRTPEGTTGTGAMSPEEIIKRQAAKLETSLAASGGTDTLKLMCKAAGVKYESKQKSLLAYAKYLTEE